MNRTLLLGSAPDEVAPRAAELYAEQVGAGHRSADRLFVVLLLVEWVGAMLTALVISPRTWQGATSTIHANLWAAVVLGGLIVSLPIALALWRTGRPSTRQAVAVGQMLIGALLIHLSGGRVETHFHVFGSLAFLALYRSWPTLLTATLVVSLDHYLRGVYWPESIFGVAHAWRWRWLEHAGWVLFEVIVLIFGCVQSLRIIRGVARREAELEATRDRFELAVIGRTAELERANQSLRAEVGERRRAEEEAQEARRASEAATRVKSEFLANMSHELRTPMNGILGMCELALDTQLNPTQREYLGMVQTSAESLLRLLNDILDFSKIEAGKLDLDPLPFALGESLEETMRTLALRAHAKDLELVCRIAPDVPPVLVGDEGRLRQVLVNLVGNAIKFTHQGEVFVAVEKVLGSEGVPELLFSVADTGIGIPAEKRRAIFEPFEQADGSTTRQYGGTGLGLAISVKLVNLMGGRIWVESEPGQGSTFRFTFRLLTAEPSTLALTRGTPGSLVGCHALIVDDNQTNCRILEELLATWGARTETVAGGPLALSALRAAAHQSDPFAIALIDAMMPSMDGFELASLIRDDPSFPAPIMVMLTSSGLAGEAQRSRDKGIHAYLTKPVRRSELRSVLERLIVRAIAAPAHLNRPEAGGPPEGTDPSATAGGQPSKRLRILLAEDHDINQRVAVAKLQKLGYLPTVVSNGREVIAAWTAGGVDLILMDLQMPEMDGLEATGLIRAAEQQTGDHVIIVALTAHAMEGDCERCLQAGCDDYLAKPIRSRDLQAVLDRHERTRAEAEARAQPTPSSTSPEYAPRGRPELAQRRAPLAE